MKLSRPGTLTFATLSLTTIALAPALAQDGPGIRGTLSFSQGIEYSDNPTLAAVSPGSEFSSITVLGFNLSSETRTQMFSLGLGATLEGALDSGGADSFGLSEKNAAVSYSREGANSRLSFGARFREVDIEDDFFGFFVDGVFDPDALIIDGGTREYYSIFGRFVTGVDGPFGLDLRARHNITNNVGTIDPDLFDKDTTRLDATARFRTNSSLTARAVAGYDRTDNEDALSTSRRNNYVGVGVEGETAGGLSYSGDITYDQSETFELGALASDDSGVGITLAATQAQSNGTIGVDVSSRIDETGRRNTASVRRSISLPNGSLSLSLGVADQEGSDAELTTRVSYVRELPDSRLRATIVQSPSTNDGDAFLNTSIRLNYMKEINAISSWDAGFSYGSANMFGGATGDTRASATVSYMRDLTEDWYLRTGVEVIRIDDDGGADRSSNTVFVNIGRDFSFGY